MPVIRIPVGMLEEHWSEFLTNSAVIGANLFVFRSAFRSQILQSKFRLAKETTSARYLNTYLVIGVLHKWRQHFPGVWAKNNGKIEVLVKGRVKML